MSKTLWKFRGYTTAAGNRVVQDWYYDELDEDDRDLIRYRINHLANIERHLWKEPGFKYLDKDLSEIRRQSSAGALRLYGNFPEDRHTFTLLHGVYKQASNDKIGKGIALARLKLLRQKIGTTHEFDFEEKPDSNNP
jgi:hypothetical protein